MDVVLERRETGGQSPAILAFLEAQGLTGDPGVRYTVSLQEAGQVVACGSLDGNVIKGVAVLPERRGEGLTEQVITELRREAFRQGCRRLFVYTKRQNEMLFSGMGFYPVASAGGAVLLESVRNGLRDYLAAIGRRGDGCGAVVMNCAPFTLGHRYLVEWASSQCHWLYVFILSENKGVFSPEDRLEMARRGCAGFSNVSVHPTEGYLISNATFPTYFLKDRRDAGKIHCALDVEIFAGKFAPALGITSRFVGQEPLDAVTRAYNEILAATLPPRGIRVAELPRLETGGAPVSASWVRAALKAGRWEEIAALTPETTLEYLRSSYNHIT